MLPSKHCQNCCAKRHLLYKSLYSFINVLTFSVGRINEMIWGDEYCLIEKKVWSILRGSITRTPLLFE